MIEQHFTLVREADRDGAARLRPVGEFDLDNHTELAQFLLEAVHDPAVDRVIIDLSATTFMDSSAIRAVEIGRAAADGAGKRFHAINPERNVRVLFEILELHDLFTDE